MSDITKIPVKNKREGEKDLYLTPAPRKCGHFQGSFLLDIDAGKCFCKQCNGEVSPMFVLADLMRKESRWMNSHERYQDEMKRLEKRSRTKCEHCHNMTRISRR